MRLSAVACLVLALASSCAQAASVAEWHGDLDAIVRDVRLRHPAPFTKTGELTFLRRADALKAALPQLTEEQRAAEAMRLIASIGDGHTQLAPNAPAFASWYPIRVYEFSDGYFVTAAHSSAADLAGAQILEVGGRPVAEAADAARDLRGADNAMGRKENLFVLSNAPLMRALGLAAADGTITLKVRLSNGRLAERALPAMPASDPALAGANLFDWIARPEVGGPPIGTADDWVTAYKAIRYAALRAPDPARPPQFIRRRAFVGQALPDKDAFYIQLNYVGGFEDKTFVEHWRGWLAEIDRLKPRRLIIDIRYNAGGDGSTIQPVIHELIGREKKPPWGDVYLLTGRRTFSAALMFYDQITRHVPLTVVGEPAGAPLNHYGDATGLDYPATGLRLTVSTLRHELSESNDRADYVRVDAPAPFSFADWAAGRDPAVDPILAGREMRSIPVIALSDGGAAATAAWRARQADSQAYPWWSPPAEITLREACDELAARNRTDDALETCRLASEVRPEVWNSWYNLAELQRRTGRKSEAMANYRKVLELDPTNFNRAEIEALLKGGA